jgi:beta-phosphoglucomutase-like phosphatase (HAD superfamily)
MRLNLIDLDGTLVSSNESLFCAYNSAIQKVFQRELPRKLWNANLGANIKDVLDLLGIADSDAIDKLYAYKNEIYPQNYLCDIDLHDFVLVHCNFHESFNFLCTMTDHRTASLVLEHFGLSRKMRTVTREDVARKKPYPDIWISSYESAPRRKGIDKTKVFIYEDSDIGIESALAALPYFEEKKVECSIFRVDEKLKSISVIK